MTTNNSHTNEKTKYKIIDTNTVWKKNLLEIFIWSFISIPALIFIFMSLFVIKTISDPNLQTMSLIFYMYICLKLFYWIGFPKIALSRSWVEDKMNEEKK